MPILKNGVKQKPIDLKLFAKLSLFVVATVLVVAGLLIALLALYEKWGVAGALALIVGIFVVATILINGVLLPRLRRRITPTEDATPGSGPEPQKGGKL